MPPLQFFKPTLSKGSHYQEQALRKQLAAVQHLAGQPVKLDSWTIRLIKTISSEDRSG